MEEPKSKGKAVATKALLQDGAEIAVKNDFEANNVAEVAIKIEVEVFEELTDTHHIAIKEPAPSKNDAEESIKNEVDNATKPEVAPKVEDSENTTGGATTPTSISSQDLVPNMVKDNLEAEEKSEVAPIVEVLDDQTDYAAIKQSASSENSAQESIDGETEDDIQTKVPPKVSTPSENCDAEPVKNKTEDVVKSEMAPKVEGSEDRVNSTAAEIPLPESDAETSIEDEIQDDIKAASESQSDAIVAAPTNHNNSNIRARKRMARKAKKDVVVATHNPDFAAEIKRITFDKEEAVAKLADDIDQDERDNDIAGMCTACEKKAVEFCGKCHCAGYCSRQCQVADWPLHKKVCPDFAGTAALDKRPSPEHRRIIFFPTHSTKPELHWAIHHETPNQSLQFGHPEFGKFSTMSYPEGSAKYEGHMVLNLTHSLGNRRVGHMLTAIAYTLHGCVPAPHSPRLVNQSINALTKPGYIRPYFGSMAVFADARRPNETVPPKIRDISARDVHSIMRLIEGRDCTSIANPTGYHGETIAGLRINDPANEFNVAMGLTTVYDAATVPLSPVWNSDFVIALAFHLGLRWYIRPAHFIGLKSGTTTWRDGNLRYLAHVCTLHVAATTTPTTTPTQGESQGAGAPAYDVVFNYGPFSGSVVILHGSGHRVNVHHVLAFNAYLDEVYVTKTTASKAGFQQFWARYQQTAGGGGGRGLSSCVPSPYRWEKPEVKDRLGVFHPDFVMQKVTGEIRGVWMATIEMMNNRK